jgi:hypothetical protein
MPFHFYPDRRISTSRARPGAERPHDGLPPSTRLVGFRWRRAADWQCSDCGLSDLPSRGERAFQRYDFRLRRRLGGSALLRFALDLRQRTAQPGDLALKGRLLLRFALLAG